MERRRQVSAASSSRRVEKKENAIYPLYVKRERNARATSNRLNIKKEASA